MEVFQTQFELDQMLTICRNQAPDKILEIGAWDGGTLIEWLKIADTVVVVDDRMRRRDEWYDAAELHETDLVLIQGRSQTADVIGRVEAQAPFDWVFIDADHTYEAVKADWDNYMPMLGIGGAIACHDIFERPGYGVSQLWSELKSRPGARWVEIGQTMDPQVHGIGVLWV